MGKFYHYTNEEGYEAIKKSKKIKKSKLNGPDAVFGKGVYLTSLSPQDRTKGGIAKNNYDGGEKPMLEAGRVNYWFEFNIEDETKLTRCEDPDKRNIWLLKDDLKFPISNHGKFEDFKEEDPVPAEDISSLEVFSD